MITLFSWGYWGWGNATEQLDQAITVAEEKQHFQPPIFVDIRWSHSVRAKGFRGDAFKDVVGEHRYRAIKDLGNEEVTTGSGKIKIHREEAVADLVNLARQAQGERRRVIFYCSCEYPWQNGKPWCHRCTVANLTLEYARQEGIALAATEWPGGEPHKESIGTVEVERNVFSTLARGSRKSLPFGERRLKEFAGVPWGSLVTARCDGNRIEVPVGPPKLAGGKEGGWQLPVCSVDQKTRQSAGLIEAVKEWRQQNGFHWSPTT